MFDQGLSSCTVVVFWQQFCLGPVVLQHAFTPGRGSTALFNSETSSYTGNLKSETLGESKNQLFAQLGREFWGGPPQSSAGCGFARAAHLSQNFCAGKGIFFDGTCSC